MEDAPLWQRRPPVNGHAAPLDSLPLFDRRPREIPRDMPVVDVDRVVCLDGVPLWELRTDEQVAEPAAGLASHLESVRLPTPDEVEAPAAPSSGGLWLASVGRLAVRTYLGARRAAADPRLTGVLRAGPSVASFIARSRVRSAGAAHDDTVVPVRTTPGLALQAYLDEVLVAVLRHPELLPKESDCASAAADIERLRDLFAREGWLDRPAAYHRDPPPPDDLETWSEHRAGLGFEHITFSSGWEPSPLEPGWARWMASRGQPDRARVGVARAGSSSSLLVGLCPRARDGQQPGHGPACLPSLATRPPRHQRRGPGPPPPRTARLGSRAGARTS